MSEWKPTQVIKCFRDHPLPILEPLGGHNPQMVEVFTWGDFQYFLTNEGSDLNIRTNALWRRAGDEVERKLILASGSIALKASNNKYVSADKEDSYFLRAEWKDAPPDLWEIFNVEDAGDGKIAFKAFNGKYVSVDSSEGGIPQLRADWVDRIGNFEKFQIVYHGNDNIAIKAFDGRYVGADHCQRGNLKSWIHEAKDEASAIFRWEPINVANVLSLHRQLLSKHDDMLRKLDEIKSLLDGKKLDEMFQNALSKNNGEKNI